MPSTQIAKVKLRRLVQLELVCPERRYGCRFLHPTLKGLAVAADYAREMRAGSQAFTRE